MNNKDRFLKYLQTCVKSTRSTKANPLLLGGHAPRDYARFLESDRLFDYNPGKWAHIDSMYDINDCDEALKIFNELIADPYFIRRDNTDNQGWRKGAIGHYVCFLNAQNFFMQDNGGQNLPLVDDSLDSKHKIWYGAPGTGKSYKIKSNTTALPEDNVIRTTFHPDSDYSTFVGAYKPIMEERDSYALDAEGLTHKIETPLEAREKIVYRYEPQAFLQAYCAAWRKHAAGEKVILVIEEINRGNCAQIFGDIFQLLDRSGNGYSAYDIKPDADITQFLKTDPKYKLADLDIEDVLDDEGRLVAKGVKIANGESLVLPNNLYIYATMNTSDQSLFPIDSAFKRRWDWEYVPIQYKNTDWKIVLGNMMYSWVEFQEKVNDLIFAATDSEDKQMGDFFVKADKDSVISEDVLFNKIVFYLWNDVCKDGEGEIFRVKRDGEKDAQDITFSKFMKGDRTKNLQDWMAYLEVKAENEDDPTL